jgi:diaminopimelate decarboxylase
LAFRQTIAAFGQIDGQLAVGGMPLKKLVDRVGSTPFFAYDRALLTDRVKMLRSTLPPQIKLSYAIKANPMPAVVQHLATLVDAFDVASAFEMRTALDTPIRPADVSFAGPGKSEASIRQAVASGVVIEIESATEVSRVVQAGDQVGLRPRIAIRVNPNFEVKGSGMRMGGGPQQFGVDAEKVPTLLTEIMAADLEFLGFHVFAGSQNLSADLICSAQRRTVDLILGLADKSPPIQYLNLGGGFGIPYFDKDQSLDLPAIASNLAELLATAIEPNLPDARVAIELGRYIVGECGVYVTRIIDRKESRGRQYLVVDGGLHHQLAASGNFGQVIRRNYPIAVGNRLCGGIDDETVTVVGCLCTPLDLLGDTVRLPHAEIGDLIVLFQAGAYGLTASPTAFLGHPPPIEVIV